MKEQIKIHTDRSSEIKKIEALKDGIRDHIQRVIFSAIDEHRSTNFWVTGDSAQQSMYIDLLKQELSSYSYELSKQTELIEISLSDYSKDSTITDKTDITGIMVGLKKDLSNVHYVVIKDIEYLNTSSPNFRHFWDQSIQHDKKALSVTLGVPDGHYIVFISMTKFDIEKNKIGNNSKLSFNFES